VEVTNTMGAAELLRKYLAEADPDLLRSMVQSFAEALISAEASGLCVPKTSSGLFDLGLSPVWL
jgi:hypothetical protein